MNTYIDTFKKKLPSFVSLKNLTEEEMYCILGMAQEFRYKKSVYETDNSLRNKYILQISKSNLARTLITFQIAVKEMGGNPLNVSLTGEKLEEYLSDTNYIKSLSLYGLTALTISTHQYQDSIRFNDVVNIPVIDVSPFHSPTEALSTILTILDATRIIKGQKITLIGDFKNDLFNLSIGLAKMNAILTLIPTSDEPIDDLLSYLNTFTTANIASDIKRDMSNCDVVYLGRSCSKNNDVITNLDVLEKKIILGCLPSDKEIGDFLTKHNQYIFKQSENLIHIQKAILSCIV